MDLIAVDEALVRSLLEEQHPDLAGLEIREVDGGWGNQMWRLGDEFAVRIPRMEGAPELLRTEWKWLPSLARRLPLPVPVPVRAGEPSDRFPWTWHVVNWVAGEPADRTPIDRAGSAETLAQFLRAMHTEAPADAPVNPSRSVPLSELGIEHWFPLAGDDPEVRRIWEAAVAAPAWAGPPLWVHGDLHPANVVVTDGALSGVIDFGEICAGDPAVDLSAGWVLLPAGAAERFFAAYGDVDEATMQRSLGWAVLKCLFLLAMGRNGDEGLPGGKKAWGPAGRAALNRVLAHTSR
ncbi:aminoglycoside phosphotransferase family protein [Kribbella sp. CA-294648]|uniref:aminoglycoside phosphotransferase family protein n=1 Tax=Kribbella sp. CA-294648 TaxID=3239948 RepID=UPI003D8EE341